MVKSAFEKAMERAAQIGSFTPEEKEAKKAEEKLKAILAGFYKGEADKNALWESLKGTSPSVLRGAQISMADSLRLGSESEEFQLRKEGILALESLKDRKNTSSIDNLLRNLEKIQAEYRSMKKQAIDELRSAIERDPRLRMKQVRLPDGRTAVQGAMSVDEAVQSRMSEFLDEHEKQYQGIFNQVIEKLKIELK